MSTPTIIVVLAVAAIGFAVALGFRAPDRVPGIDDAAERERIDH